MAPSAPNIENDLLFNIYSHADADGGIAAAIFARHILSKYGTYGWHVNYTPVNHGAGQEEWSTREISWPCAILDFTLHPSLLSDRFHGKRAAYLQQLKHEHHIPGCSWIDHHPTGSSYSFLSAENSGAIMPLVQTKWDCSAISTPGLLRTHHVELGISRDLIEEYADYIDYAEIIDGALYASAQSAHDYTSPTIKLQTLFSSSHPCIDRNALFRRLVRAIQKSAKVEELFDFDPIFWGVIEYEQSLHSKQLQIYEKHSVLKANVVVSNFLNAKKNEGMGRFIPYLLHPEAEYAIHVIPKKNGVATISCGINPWNKPKGAQSKHLGNYFAEHFGGGGHAFVAGGKFPIADGYLVDQLVEFIVS